MRKVIVALVIALTVTGCHGYEAHVKAGFTRIDEAESRQAMTRKPLPLKCLLWADCGSSTGEVGYVK